MIIYSVSILVDKEIEKEWINWMVDEHIQDVMRTGYFTAFTIRQGIEPETAGKVNYVFEYSCENLDRFRQYEKHAAPALRKAHMDRYGARFAAERKLYAEI